MAKALSGKVALVTGASSGIGEATALALAAAGASVAVSARRIDRLKHLVDRIEKASGEAMLMETDVTQQANAEAMVAATEQRFGGLDILVNNAGVMLLARVEDANPADWRRMIETNLLGPMYAARAALPSMKRRGSGHIVNISSVAGRVASPTGAGYDASKFGIVGFSEALRREVYKYKIRVTVIEPGVVKTELREHIPDPSAKQATEAWAESMRQLQPEDIAAAIMYAVSQPDRVGVTEIMLRPTDQER